MNDARYAAIMCSCGDAFCAGCESADVSRDDDDEPSFDESAIMLILDDHRGIYIPRDWYQECYQFKPGSYQGVPADVADLENPDNEWYDDCWTMVLDNVTYTDDAGIVWTLYQNGALFYIRQDADIPEDWWYT